MSILNTGWVDAGTGSGITNSSNITSSNNTYATASHTFTDYDYDLQELTATNFGFEIPDGATIKGVQMRVEDYYEGGIIEHLDWSMDGPSLVGVTSSSVEGTTLSGTESYTVYPLNSAENNLWGATLTPSVINNSNFGVYIPILLSGESQTTTAYIDNVQMKIFYEPLNTGWVSPTSTGGDYGEDWSDPANAYALDDAYASWEASSGGSAGDIKAEIRVDGSRFSSKYGLLPWQEQGELVLGGSSDDWDGDYGGDWTLEEFAEDNFILILSGRFWGSSSQAYSGFDFGLPVGSTIDGVEVSITGERDTITTYQGFYVDHIQIKVYYTESAGTAVNSERGLYLVGYDTGSSERPLYIQGYLTNNSERNLYLEGNIDSLYSRESDGTLGTDDSNLATTFSIQDYTDVGTDNDTYVDLEGIAQYFEFLFKEPNANNTDDFRITWKGKSSLAPSSSTVYLQIYNRTTTSWATLTSNSSASADTKFTLTHDITTDLSDYYDANYVISARIYQDVI